MLTWCARGTPLFTAAQWMLHAHTLFIQPWTHFTHTDSIYTVPSQAAVVAESDCRRCSPSKANFVSASQEADFSSSVHTTSTEDVSINAKMTNRAVFFICVKQTDSRKLVMCQQRWFFLIVPSCTALKHPTNHLHKLNLADGEDNEVKRKATKGPRTTTALLKW